VYKIEFDEQAAIVTARLSGSWDVAEVERYRDDLNDTVTRLKSGHPRLSMLADGRELSLTTQEVAAAFNALSGSKYMELIDRIAILVSKMLNKLQAERMDGSKIRVFMDEDAAIAWLKS